MFVYVNLNLCFELYQNILFQAQYVHTKIRF